MSAESWHPVGGEMAVLIHRHDWSGTSLGDLAGWPQSLRTATDLILGSPLPMIILWGPDLVQVYNDGYRDIMAAKHPAGLGQPTRECWPEVWHFAGPIYRAVQQGGSRSFAGQKLTLRRRGVDEDVWFDLNYSPLRDESGTVAGVLVTVVETTDRVAAERALRESEARLRLAHEVAAIGTFEWDVATDQNRWSPEIERLYGLPQGSFGGRLDDWRRLVHPDDLPEAERLLARALETGVLEGEWRAVRPDGTIVWLLARGVVEKDAGGRPVRMVGANFDISGRVRSEEHRKLLLAELDHRVKNVLAVVQAMARQSLRGVDEAQVDRFVGRLAALARSHNALAENGWQGAGLYRLVADAVAAYRSENGMRVTLGGPDVHLTPRAAQSLGLALHELMTNAAKYGALTAVDGAVDVGWSLQGDGAAARLVVVWRESGGPPVEAPPSRSGFGTRLIELTVAVELDGRLDLDYRRSGLVATPDLPLATLAAGAPAR